MSGRASLANTRGRSAKAWSFLALAATLGLACAGRDIRITYNSDEDGTAVTRNFDLLVVACDPTSIADAFDGRTELEERAASSLQR